MNKKVKIKKDKLGNVIRTTKNPEYGYVVLKQKRLTINTDGCVNAKKFTALLKGRIEDLKDMDLDNTKSLPGNIAVIESTRPFDSSNPDRDLKIAGDTGIILCTEDGEPIYRKTVYDQTGTMMDVLIPHANGDEIRKHNSKQNTEEETEEEEEEINSEYEDDNQTDLFDETSEDEYIEDEFEDETVFTLGDD